MYRITKKMLQNRVMRLNKLTNNPVEPWENGEANVGNYHLDGAYGGYALYQTMNTAGGVNDISQQGHMPVRALFDLIEAFMRGYQTAKQKS